jgi:NADH-quinone oxidoreductase subunit F
MALSINTFGVYRKHGGYRSVEKALKTMTLTLR